MPSRYLVAIGLVGDDRGFSARLGPDAAGLRRGRQLQLSRELLWLDDWLDHEEQSAPLGLTSTLLRRRTVETTATFFRGVLTFEPDARKFDPSPSRLVQLCAICDLSAVEYDDRFELFRSEPQSVDESYLAYRALVHSAEVLANVLLRQDASALAARSSELDSIGLFGLQRLGGATALAVDQIH